MPRLVGFAPDLDPKTPGILIDCINILPTVRGVKATPSAIDAGADAFGEDVLGISRLVALDGTWRVFVGGDEAIKELIDGGYADVSRSGGYTSGDKYWRFSQFGNISIASNGIDPLQFAAQGDDFDDIAGAPTARVVVTVSGFVMALAITGGAYGNEPDRWWCSALYDYTDWTPDIATQCATARLLDSPGDIRGGASLGDNLIVYKERSMYLGQYVGNPYIWTWSKISDTIGAVSHEAIVSAEGVHYFIGSDDIWMFDGGRPVSIGAAVRNWFFNDLYRDYIYKIKGIFDAKTSLVWFYYPSIGSDGSIDSALIYNTDTQSWGRASVNAIAPIIYREQGYIYDNLGDTYATYDDLPTAPYVSPFWLFGQESNGFIGTDGKIYTLNGAGDAARIVLPDIGDDWRFSTLRQVRPRYISQPDSATLTHRTKTGEGVDWSAGTTSDLYDHKFDTLRSGRYHQIQVDSAGSMEIIDLSVDLKMDGGR